MAINIMTEPNDPASSNTDWTQITSINAATEVPKLSILDNWESTGSEPVVVQGCFLSHASNTFKVESANESISGSPASGLNYIVATESGGVITLAWTQTITGYAYNPAQGGIYNGSGQQLLRDVCYLDGSDYVRGFCFGMDFNTVFYANGDLYLANDLTVGNDLTVVNSLSVGNDSYAYTDTVYSGNGTIDFVANETFGGVFASIEQNGSAHVTTVSFQVYTGSQSGGLAWRTIESISATNGSTSGLLGQGAYFNGTLRYRINITNSVSFGSGPRIRTGRYVR